MSILIQEYLLENNYISEEQLNEAEKIAEKNRRIVCMVLFELEYITLEQLVFVLDFCASQIEG